MTLLAFWPQYVKDLKCLQPCKNEVNKYVNQSMFIYSLAELKHPDSRQKLCAIYDSKWLNTSEFQTPGVDEHIQEGPFLFCFLRLTKLPIISFL